MYSKMLRQFSKESLISISSESSKIQLLVIFFFCIGLFGLTFAGNISCSMFWMSSCVISSSATFQCLNTQVFRHKIFQLCQCCYTRVRGHSHIESSHGLCQNDVKFQTNPPIPFTSKCQICRKSMFITSGIKLV